MTATPTLRFARPTDNLTSIAAMYRIGLGLSELATFENHQGFDGIILGRPDQPYHLEFTHHRGHPVERAPHPDLLLVFYLPVRSDWEAGCDRMRSAGFREVPSYNPYWDVHGRTFEDPDGYRVVLQHGEWTA